jgi:hypothetical protein
MLNEHDVLDSLMLMDPLLPGEHPLVTWAVQYIEEWQRTRAEPRDESADRGPEDLRPLLDVALSDAGDPYCRAFALSLLCSTSGDVFLEDPAARAIRRRAYDDIGELADASDEPILAFWLADAALGLAEQVKPPYAAELEVFAWRMGCRLREPFPVAMQFYVYELFTKDHDTIKHVSYTVPARLALVRHLRALQPGTFEQVYNTIEARCAAASAIFDAEQGRRQGVLLHARVVTQCYAIFIRQFARTLETGEGPPEDVLHHFVWYPSWLADPLRTVADAFLLVGMPNRALESLAKASELDPYDGVASDVALIRKVMRRRYELGAGHG